MATITHREITYTSSAGALNMIMDLPLQGGVDQDDLTWLGGSATGGSTSNYPGALTSFAARQTDGANVYNPRLCIVHWSTATDNATLTLSGNCSEILHTSVQWAESNAAPGLSQHVATGILVNDGSHWLTSEATNAVDGGIDAYAHFSVGDFVMDAEGAIMGTFKSATASPGPATALTLDANSTVQVNDNGAIHKRTPLILTNTSGTTESMTLMMLII